jgi:hypothetical protein
MGSSAEVRFRKPNLLQVSVSSPQIAKNQFVCDGRELTVYDSRLNQYAKSPAPPTLLSVYNRLNEMANSAFQFKIDSTLDPVYFLQGHPLPPGINWVARKETADLEGVKCWVIDGLPQLRVASAKGRISFWVEKDTHLIRKVERVITGAPVVLPVKSVKDGKTVVERKQFLVDQTITERIQDRAVNPPLDDSTFKFIPPKGAIERNPEKVLRK